MRIVLLSFLLIASGINAQENLCAKYTALLFGGVTFFEMGAEQGFWMTDKQSKWPAYSEDTMHAHWFLQRGSMVSAGLLMAHWYPKQQLISLKTLNQFIGVSCLYSWMHNRGLRLVQTGELFPPEKGHKFYIDFGFIRIEVNSSDTLQWGMLGAGLVLLTLDAVEIYK